MNVNKISTVRSEALQKVPFGSSYQVSGISMGLLQMKSHRFDFILAKVRSFASEAKQSFQVYGFSKGLLQMKSRRLDFILAKLIFFARSEAKKQSHQYTLLFMGLLRFVFRRLNTPLAKVALILIFFSGTIYTQENNIEFVESIPVETTLDNPDIRNTQEVWLEMINSAQKTLDIEQFYISNKKCEALDTVLNAIIAAANRGVKVRIIVDAKMYKIYPEDVDWLDDQSPNITTRKIDFSGISTGIQHAKYFIADGKDIFLGSQNFDWRALNHIHELGIRHRNMFELYKHIFEYDWCLANENNDNCYFQYPLIEVSYSLDSNLISNYMHPVFSSVNSIGSYQIYEGKDNDPKEHIKWLEDIFNINKMIYEAKKEINLQFLSYNPVTKEGYWEEIDTALINATKRGVTVKLMVSDWNLGKTAVEHFKELIGYPNFEVRFTSIPEYSGGFIPYARVSHCKYIVADEYIWIGTGNMSYSYFYESRNIGMIIEDRKFSNRVREFFYNSWNSEYAHPIEPNGEYVPRSRE